MTSTNPSILLFGLDSSLEQELVALLGGFRVTSCNADCPDGIDDADLIFCSAVGHELRSLMDITNRMKSHPAVIVVSRLPEESRQLDAIEAGAQGYVAAPFEPQRLGGLLRACMAQPAELASAMATGALSAA